MNPQLADLSDLREWADRNVSRSQLALLLRRLILATSGADLLRAPAGDAVGEHGWDIQLDVPGGLPPFVPPGLSHWEGGVGGKPRVKAQRDFKKRTEETTPAERANRTFVFFTPRHFEDSEDWLDDKAKENHAWAAIKIVDGVILEEWLESQPAVHIWFSELIGKLPTEVGALSTWWERWSGETDPAMPAGLVTAGRAQAAADLRAALRSGAQAIPVVADTFDEALAFVAASLQDTPTDGGTAEAGNRSSVNDQPDADGGQAVSVTGLGTADASGVVGASGPNDPERDAFPARNALLVRAVVVDSSDAWSRLMHHSTPLILIPRFSDPDVGTAVAAGHHVVIPSVSRRQENPLPRIRVDHAADALRQVGVDFSKAHDYARSARRSLSSLRRRLAKSVPLRDPEWSEGSDTSMLGPMLLFGGWHEDFAADIELVEEFADTKWRRLSRDLQALARKPDSPIRVDAKEWQFLDPIDAWDLLAEAVTSTDLEAFHTVVVEILAEPDPVLSLPADEQMTAQMNGVRRKYSGTLRRGMATTLAVLGAVVADRTLQDGSTGQQHATIGVRDVLASDEPDHWLNLAPLLPILAEAAPDAFLEAVERAWSAAGQPLLAMFQEGPKTALGKGQSVHHHLLWSLEGLTFSRQHASRALLLLAKLAEIDPGDDRSLNRPASSIVTSLHLMHPQSAVTDKTRPEILNLLEARSPQVSFDVMIRLVRGISGETIFSVSGPHWRDWALPETNRTLTQVYEGVKDILQRLISRLAEEPKRAKDLVQLVPDPLTPERRALLDTIVGAAQHLDESGRQEVAEELAEMASRYQQAPEGAVWAIPADDVQAIADAATSLSADVFAVPPVEWFSYWPRAADTADPEVDIDQLIDENRTATIRVAYEAGGLSTVVELAEASQAVYLVGRYLARHTDVSDEDVFALNPSLDDFQSTLTQLVLGYAAERFIGGGIEWLTNALDQANEQVQALLLRAVDVTKEVLQLLDSHPSGVQDAYWRYPLRAGLPEESVRDYAQRLLSRGLEWSALVVLIIHARRNKDGRQPGDADLQLEALEAVQGSKEDPTEIFRHHAYGLGKLLDQLSTAGVDQERLAQVEYYFYPVLEHSRQPSALYREIARNPNLFASIVIGSYRRETDDADTKDESESGEEAEHQLEATESTANVTERTADPEAAEQRRLVFRDDDLLDDAVARHLFGRHGWSLLRHWRGLPGQAAKHDVDLNELRAWVHSVLELVDALDRPTTGRQSVGQVLSSPVTDADGTWPHRAVRDILEELQDTQIERGLLVGRFNQRGVTVRSPYDGGAKERTLAQRYRAHADAVRDTWPRAGAILDDLAKGYESDGRREDRSVEE